MTSYVILKDANAGRRRSWFEGGKGIGGVPSAGGVTTMSGDMPPEPEVSVEDLAPQDLREATRDPGILDLARTMPTRLIAPMESDAAVTAGPTWGIKAVGADNCSADGRDVLTCVLDTGIDAGHPAFAGMDLVQKDFTGKGNGDVQGHGTHCAGTVFGRDVDGTRIGVAPGVSRALIGKVLDDEGGGESDMLFNAMLWASSLNAAERPRGRCGVGEGGRRSRGAPGHFHGLSPRRRCCGLVVAAPEGGGQHSGNRERGGDPHAGHLPDRCLPCRRRRAGPGRRAGSGASRISVIRSEVNSIRAVNDCC